MAFLDTNKGILSKCLLYRFIYHFFRISSWIVKIVSLQVRRGLRSHHATHSGSDALEV